MPYFCSNDKIADDAEMKNQHLNSQASLQNCRLLNIGALGAYRGSGTVIRRCCNETVVLSAF